MFACLDGIISPIICAIVIQYFTDIKQAWNSIFYFAIFLYIIGVCVFTAFASAEPQPWAIATFKEIDPSAIKKKNKKQKNDQNQSLA